MRRRTEVLLFRWLLPHHLVVFMVSSAIISFISAYLISVLMKLVSALFPAISTAGTEPPASCVFALFLNLAASFCFMCVYIRHGNLESKLPETYSTHVINDVGLLLGFLSAFGMMMVAAFQSRYATIPHLIGAGMAFLLGVMYAWFQTYLSYLVAGSIDMLIKIRIVLSGCASLGFLLTSTLGAIAARRGASVKDKLHWNAKDPGWKTHIGSTFCEWIMACCLLSFFLTYYKEFKNVDYKVHVKNKESSGS